MFFMFVPLYAVIMATQSHGFVGFITSVLTIVAIGKVVA